jgi:hypothetical protein
MEFFLSRCYYYIADPTAKYYKNNNDIIGKAAEHSEKRKQNNYNKIIDYNNIQTNNLIIFAIETHGGLAKNAKEFCHKIAKVNDNFSFELHQIYAELSIITQIIRHNIIYSILHDFSKKIEITNDFNTNQIPTDIINNNSSQIDNSSHDNSSINHIENFPNNYQIDNSSYDDASITHIEIIPDNSKPINNTLTSLEIKLLYIKHLLKNDINLDYANNFSEDELLDIYDTFNFPITLHYKEFITSLHNKHFIIIND